MEHNNKVNNFIQYRKDNFLMCLIFSERKEKELQGAEGEII